MSNCITICPIGVVEEDILGRITKCIEKHHDLVCKISPGMEKPNYAYDERRGQYNSKLILKHLIKCCPQDTLRFIGVTHVDLYVPILKFVFGLAQMEGQCAVISIHRLRPQFYNLPPDPDLLVARVEKTVLHELGHSLGLTHCRDRRCVMYSSTRIEDTDFKRSDYCPTCFELFRWRLDKCLTNANP